MRSHIGYFVEWLDEQCHRRGYRGRIARFICGQAEASLWGEGFFAR